MFYQLERINILFNHHEVTKFENYTTCQLENSASCFPPSFSATKIFLQLQKIGIVTFDRLHLLENVNSPLDQRVTSNRASNFINAVGTLPKFCMRFLQKRHSVQKIATNFSSNFSALSYTQVYVKVVPTLPLG